MQLLALFLGGAAEGALVVGALALLVGAARLGGDALGDRLLLGVRAVGLRQLGLERGDLFVQLVRRRVGVLVGLCQLGA